MTMAASSPSPDHGVPIGTGSSDEPAQVSGADTPVAAADSAVPERGPRSRSRNHEEPELRSEPDLPSDGPDEEGEAMIRELSLRPELSDPAAQPESEPTEK